MSRKKVDEHLGKVNMSNLDWTCSLFVRDTGLQEQIPSSRMYDEMDAEKAIPYETSAFWGRVEGYLIDWLPSLKTQKHRVSWLARNADIDRPTIYRWSRGKNRPKWLQIPKVLAALEVAAKSAKPEKAVPPTMDDLLRGLSRAGAASDQSASEDDDDEGESTTSDSCESGTEDLFAQLLEFLVDPPDKMGKTRPSALAVELRRKKYGDDPETIARALPKASAQQIAADLADIVISKPGDLRERARAMLWFLLPHAADIAGTVARAKESAPGSPIELVLATKTLGEIAVAGVASRPCEWAPEGTQPEGTRHVPMPSSALGAFFDTKGRLIAEGTLMKVMRKDAVENLLRERRAGEPRVPSDTLWNGIAKEYPDEARRHAAVMGELRAGGRYMLVIDADLGERSQEDIEAAWQVTQGALKEALPGLLLVRLKGDKARFDRDQEIVPNVRRARDGRL